MESKINWAGTFIIKSRDKTEVIKNKVMDTVLSQLIATLQGVNPNLQIKYLALGTSNTPVTVNDTQLGAEIFRTPISSQSNPSTGQLVTDFIILDSEAVGTIQEIGIFGGTTATSTANTGTLISRILWNKIKTNAEEINIRRIDTIGRG